MIQLYIKQIMLLLGRKPVPSALRALGMSNNQAHNLLNGKVKSVKLKTLFDICTMLHCTPNELFTISEKDCEGLPEGHPLRKLKKPTHSHAPADLVKTIPVERLQEANELLLGFLGLKKDEE